MIGKKNIKYINAEPNTATIWIAFAKSYISLARQGKVNEDTLYETLCYLCHQAGELALKAIMIHNSVAYPTDHSLEVLVMELEENNISVPIDVKDTVTSISLYGNSFFPLKFPFKLGGESVTLTEHAKKTRYPGDYTALDEIAYKHAFTKADKIVKWAERQINLNR